MNRTSRFVVVGLVAVSASIALAQTARDKQPTKPTTPTTPNKPTSTGAPQHDMQLPPGWTEADMQACMAAGTPGEQHQWLQEGVGKWQGTSKMWMAPDTPAIESPCTSTVTSLMDGRYIKVEVDGETPMGPFNGVGINGYDNVAQTFQATWIDNCSTGIMNGTGELSSDRKTMTWTFKYHCPITKKQTTMREVQKFPDKNTMVMEMYGTDPKSNKEFKMMEISFKRVGGGSAISSAQPTSH